MIEAIVPIRHAVLGELQHCRRGLTGGEFLNLGERLELLAGMSKLGSRGKRDVRLNHFRAWERTRVCDIDRKFNGERGRVLSGRCWNLEFGNGEGGV